MPYQPTGFKYPEPIGTDRIVAPVATVIAGSPVPPPMACLGDPNYALRVLSVHMADAERDPLFASNLLNLDFTTGAPVDYSPSAATITIVGSGVVNSSNSLFGLPTYQNLTPGASDRISVPGFASITNATSFDLEFWFYPVDVTTTQTIFVWGDSESSGHSLWLNISGGTIRITTSSMGTITANQWYHVHCYITPGSPGNWNYTIAVATVAGVTAAGVIGGGTLFAATGAGVYSVAGSSFSTTPLKGYLGPLRHTNGVRYQNASQPPPVDHYPLIRGVDVLVDTSPNVKTVTVGASGFPTTVRTLDNLGTHGFVVRRQPAFGSQFEYFQAATNADFNFGAGDFTVLIYALTLSNPSNFNYLFEAQISAGLTMFLRQQFGGGAIACGIRSSSGSVGGTTTFFPTLGTYVEYVIQRRGTNFEVGANGALIFTAAVPGGAGATCNYGSNPWTFGSTNTPSADGWDGTINQVMVWKGVAAFTFPHVVQTLPFCDSTMSH